MSEPPQIDFTNLVGDPTQAARREEMVETQVRARGIRDARVLLAMVAVPRHVFLPPAHLAEAYMDHPLPIGNGQTISQPFIVASMTEALALSGSERVLEIGTGSGYQTAILSILAREAHTVEMHENLSEAARELLSRLGRKNIHFHVGDGTLGWPEAAPFDAIVVTAAAPSIPPPLVEQLGEGGRMVLPLGPADNQNLYRVRREGPHVSSKLLYSCRFVPLIGRYGWSSTDSR